MKLLNLFAIVIILQTLTYVDDKTGRVIETYTFSVQFPDNYEDIMPNTPSEFDESIDLEECSELVGHPVDNNK